MNTTLKAVAGLLFALPLAVAAAARPAAPFTDAEIDALLAPVALYPDSVLSHVLIAATVPEDLEDAAEWSRRHPDLKGQAAVDAVAKKDWDPSVKALVAFPDVLARMDEDPEWTGDLGEAFLEQEATVMDRVQYLRDRADEAGTLEKVEHVRVVREREYIYLEPAVERVVYVPYYDPWYAYGSWWWPHYPPHRWAYWGGYPVHHYHGSTFYWGVAFHLGPSYYYSRFNWPHRHVVVSRPHRHYAPSPGYAGRSTMRRPNSWQGAAHSAVREARRSERGSGWREDTRWRNHDTRRPAERQRGHDQRQPRADHPGYRSERRNAEHVRDELSQRRESRGQSAEAHERRDQAHERRDERRVERRDERRDDRRDERRDEGREERRGDDRGPRPESRPREDRDEPPSRESHRQGRPHDEPRQARPEQGRREAREQGERRESRGEGPRQSRGERPQGGGREMSRGRSREQGPRQQGGSRRER